LNVGRVQQDDEALGVGSKAASAVFAISSDGQLTRPAKVRFALDGVPTEERSRLRVAHRESASEMWTLHPGTVAGAEFVYLASSFSQMQLRTLSPTLQLRSTQATVEEFAGLRAQDPKCGTAPAGTEYEVVARKRRPVVAACIESVEGGVALVKLANKRSNGLAMRLPQGAELKSVSGRGLSEEVWRTVYKALGDDSLFIPGGGTASVLLRTLPAEIKLSGDNSAMATDAMIYFAAGGKLGEGAAKLAGRIAEYAQCIHSAASADQSQSTATQLASFFRELWSNCGSKLGQGQLATAGAVFFGPLKLGTQFVDSVRDLSNARSTVEVFLSSGGSVSAPSPGFSYRYDLQWRFGDGETATGILELGELKKLSDVMAEGYDPQCFRGDESRAAVISGRFDITNETPNFNLRIAPTLQPKVFEVQRGAFTGDAIGTRITNDETARIETADGCPELSATSTMFGASDVPPDSTFGAIDFKLLYPDIYGPQAPEGNADRIEALAVALYPTPGAPLFGARLKCLSGLGTGLGELIPVTGQDLKAVGQKYDLEASRRVRGC